MNWELRIRRNADKLLRRFPKNDQKYIVAALQEMDANPYAGDVVKLEGADNAWRRRIGAYRIFYEIIPKDKAIYVFRIERRASGTY